jgi:FKBP-type peptidyl-prolyl cis-trans isomerase
LPAELPRPTTADNVRTDDHWIEGERCAEDDHNGTGVRFEIVETGTGREVGIGETVRVHYVARSSAGETLHDTHTAGLPVELIIGSTHTICGFEKGLYGMRAGEQRRIYVPWNLGFGEQGRTPDVLPRTDLVFVVDMYLPADSVIEHRSAPPRPAAPSGGGRRR